jgi:hypothetical protein
VVLSPGETIWRDESIFILLLQQTEGKGFIRAIWPWARGAIQGAIQLSLRHATDKVIRQPAPGVKLLHLFDAQSAISSHMLIAKVIIRTIKFDLF